MKKLFLLITLFVGMGFGLSAQITPMNEAVYKANGFIHAKDLWMCESYVKDIDMALEAFGVALTAQGKWYEMKPGAYTIATTSGVQNTPNAGDYLNNNLPVSNVFSVSPRGYGIYEFLYVNENPSFCGMLVGEQSIFRVYIVPELAGFSVNSQLCTGDNLAVNLRLNIPADVQYFISRVGWNFSFKTYPLDVAVTMPVTVNAGGVKEYTYKIDDSAGPFAGKFNGMNSNYKCQDSARITHSVTIILDSITNAPGNITKTYCLDNLKLQHPTTYEININSLLNFTAPTNLAGPWSTTSSFATINQATGVATINTSTMTPTKVVDFIYTYLDKCGNNVSTKTIKVSLIFGDDTDISQVIKDNDTTVCRNLIAGEVSLLDLLAVELPATAGIWIDKDGTMLSSGTVNLGSLSTGVKYPFEYSISPAISNQFCSITKYLVTLGVTVQDVNGYNSGQTQICKDILGQGQTMNLTQYIAGLPMSSDVKWFKFDQASNNYVAVANPATYPIDAANLNKVGTTLFKFEYNTLCGNAEGMLYATVTDRITNYDNKEVKYCFLDSGSDKIDLFQVLGVAGLKGTWSVESSTGTTPVTLAGSVFDGKANYLADNVAVGTTNTAFTYVFKYTPNADGCGIVDPVTVTVIVTPDIVTP